MCRCCTCSGWACWSCSATKAFSVNQHASICGGFGREPPPYTFEWKAWHAKTCDSVTGEPFTPCTCKMEKIFCHEDNEDPRCELNKFDAARTRLGSPVSCERVVASASTEDMMHHIYVGEKASQSCSWHQRLSLSWFLRVWANV